MRRHVSRIYMAIVFLFLYSPIAVMAVFSFNASKSRTVWTGFTFDWYYRLFHNQTIINSLGVTIIVALVASVISTVIGTAAAIGLFNMKKKTRGVIMYFTYLPLLNPEIVTGVSLMLLYVSAGISMGFVTLILAHISFCVPYVILNVMPKLRQMDTSLCEAAMDLGCNQRGVFGRVVIPEIMPGILTGFLMSITYSIDDFVISYFTHGANSQNLSVTIYSMTRKKVSPEINALSTIIFLVVLTVLLVMNISDARRQRKLREAVRTA
ncbi:MAG: ABC transporter permease [Clostridia bacterium]|nr:ABC transporter permease [Clostridia bacterium]